MRRPHLFLPVYLFVLGLCFSDVLWAKITIEASGSIPRGSGDIFYLDVTLRGLSKTPPENNVPYTSRLNIIIKNYDETKEIPFEAYDLDKLATAEWVIRYIGNEEVDTSDPNSNTATAKFEIVGNAGKLKEALGSGSSLTLELSHRDETVDKVTVVVTIDSSVAAEAPENFSASGTHLGIAASWTLKESITFSKGESKAPQGVNVFVVERALGNVVVDALVHNPNASSDTETASCTISTQITDGDSCVSCDKENTYIDITKLPETVVYGRASAGQNTLVVSGLKENQEYVVFATYRPDGLKTTACRIALATRNYTLCERLDPECKSVQKEPFCFIATAVYGSVLAKDLFYFRWFRDHILRRFALGRLFIKKYYSWGPAAAKFIEKHDWLKGPLQVGLWSIARFLEFGHELLMADPYTELPN